MRMIGVLAHDRDLGKSDRALILRKNADRAHESSNVRKIQN